MGTIPETTDASNRQYFAFATIHGDYGIATNLYGGSRIGGFTMHEASALRRMGLDGRSDIFSTSGMTLSSLRKMLDDDRAKLIGQVNMSDFLDTDWENKVPQLVASWQSPAPERRVMAIA